MIREFTPDDIDAVAALYERVMRSGAATPPPGLAGYFLRLLEPGLSSFVYENAEGDIAGFIAIYERRFLLDGKPLRAACSGQLVVAPESRSSAAGVFLAKAFVDGPQDFSFTDGASFTMRRIWERLGGYTSPLGTMRWTRRLALRKGRAPDGEELTPRLLAEVHADVLDRVRLRPDYDATQLAFMFRELHALPSRGELHGALVRDAKGRPLGWHLYFVARKGASQVLHTVAKPGHEPAVLAHLFADARARGARTLQGRVEPAFVEALHGARAKFDVNPSLVLVHSRNDAAYAALFQGSAHLSRTEGDWWMGHHLEPFTEPSTPPRPSSPVAPAP